MSTYENGFKDFYQSYIHVFKKAQKINDISNLKINLDFSTFNAYRNITKCLEEYKDIFTKSKQDFILSLNRKYFNYLSLIIIENHKDIKLNNIEIFNKNKFNKIENDFDSIIPYISSFKTIFKFYNMKLLNMILTNLEFPKFKNIFDKLYNIHKIIKGNGFHNVKNNQNIGEFVLLAEKLRQKTKNIKTQASEDFQKIKDLFTTTTKLTSNGPYKLSSPFKPLKRSGNSRFSIERQQSYYLSRIVPRSKIDEYNYNDQEQLQTQKSRSRSECPPPKKNFDEISQRRNKTQSFNNPREKRLKDPETSEGLLKRGFAIKARRAASLPRMKKSDSLESLSPKPNRKTFTNKKRIASFLNKKEFPPRNDFFESTDISPSTLRRKEKHPEKMQENYDDSDSSLELSSESTLEKFPVPSRGRTKTNQLRKVPDETTLKNKEIPKKESFFTSKTSMLELSSETTQPDPILRMRKPDTTSKPIQRIRPKSQYQPRNVEKEIYRLSLTNSEYDNVYISTPDERRRTLPVLKGTESSSMYFII